MPLIRGHHSFDDHFARIPNDWLRDDRLSLEARGLLAQIMSHKPGWNLSIRSISAQNRIGKEKVRRIIEELMRFEYLERSDKQGKDEKGRMTSYDYITRDPLPRTAEPRTENPHTANRPTKKTKPIEEQTNKKTIDIESLFAQFWAVYPLKKDKRVAFKAFEKAIKRASIDDIVAGAERYRDDPNREDAFTKYPQGWLNADAWENDPLPSRVVSKPRKLTNAEEGFLLVQRLRERDRMNAEEPKELDYDMGITLKGVDDA